MKQVRRTIIPAIITITTTIIITTIINLKAEVAGSIFPLLPSL